MKRLFTNDTLEKYKEVFEKILKENKNFADALKKYSKGPNGSTNNLSKYLMIVASIVFAGAWFYTRYYKTNKAPEEIVA